MPYFFIIKEVIYGTNLMSWFLETLVISLKVVVCSPMKHMTAHRKFFIQI